MAENTHYSQNAYSRDHFPDNWDDEDFEFLASFLANEFGVRFQAVIDPERDYDYELFARGDSGGVTTPGVTDVPQNVPPSSSPDDSIIPDPPRGGNL